MKICKNCFAPNPSSNSICHSCKSFLPKSVISAKPDPNIPPKSDIPKNYIDSLNREVRMCCYQSARLQDKYCWCGRAIHEDLLAIFET